MVPLSPIVTLVFASHRFFISHSFVTIYDVATKSKIKFYPWYFFIDHFAILFFRVWLLLWWLHLPLLPFSSCKNPSICDYSCGNSHIHSFFSLLLLVLELSSFVLLQHFCLCVLTFHSSEIMAWLYLLYTNISYNGRISHKWCKYLCTGVLCKWVFYPLFIHLFIFICSFDCIFPRACNGSFWYLEDNQHHPVCLLDFMQFSQVLKVRMLRCLS